MTYCLGILVSEGLVLASDSRSNAGVDQVQTVCKLTVLAASPAGVIALAAAGNLATTQSVVTQLQQAAGSGRVGADIKLAKTLFDVASVVGTALRSVVGAESKYVKAFGEPGGSFLLGGQLAGEPPRLFEVYEAGNFIEAQARSAFLQIGETKYGKPILDRALSSHTTLDDAAKLALLSFDATMRSNLSVGPPIDMLRYPADSFSATDLTTLDEDNAYWRTLRDLYGKGLLALVDGLPPPPRIPSLTLDQ
jgi:putative proteasome-type protease